MSSAMDCKECDGMPLPPEFATKEGQMAVAYILLVASLEQLQSENAKLRELVKDIHTLATDYGVCVQYPYCEAWDERLAVAEKQMRELGIEAWGIEA